VRVTGAPSSPPPICSQIAKCQFNSRDGRLLKYSLMIVSAAILAAVAAPAVAQQSNQAKAGVLACRTSASLGLIVGSHQKLRCRFTPDAGGPPETYVGHINRLGLDLGVRAGGSMVWAVLAPTNGMHRPALTSERVGVSL
jgi:Protein of unknown function (DUF992)